MVHLHVHSDYSLQDAIPTPSELAQTAKEKGWKAISLTDHGTMAGVLELQLACDKHGIEPLFGVELYAVPDVQIRVPSEKRYHLVVFPIGEEGLRELVTLASMAYIRGFYRRPRIDLRMFEEVGTEHLVVLTACAYSSVVYCEELWGKILEKFAPDRLYLEIMVHPTSRQAVHNMRVMELADRMGLPLVLTHDVHYLDASHAGAHQYMMKMQKRDPYESDTFYLAGVDDLIQMWREYHSYIPKRLLFRAMQSTEDVASRVGGVRFPVGKFQYPKFPLGGEVFEAVRAEYENWMRRNVT